MPKRVDHEERRRALAEAVCGVIAARGYDAVSLRDVAAEAGVSMGAVQHYFRSKDEMLRFALEHLRSRVAARLESELAALRAPGRREIIRTALRVTLPVDRPSRQEARVNIAFFSAATTTPPLADLLREGYSQLLELSRSQLRAAAAAGELADGVDIDVEADALYFLCLGLVGPLLIGPVTAEQALAVLDHQLGRLFR